MATSDCANILNLIPLYIDNMLSDEETDIVCEHIENCASCRSEYEFLKSVMTNAKHLPEIEVPKEFHHNLMDKVRAETKGGKSQKRRFLGWRSFAGIAAAAAVIAVSIVSYINLEGSGNSVNPDEFIPSTYPSAEPDEVNSDQITDVVLPDTESAEATGNDEHTQAAEIFGNNAANKENAASSQRTAAVGNDSRISTQTENSADSTSVKSETSVATDTAGEQSRTNTEAAKETPTDAPEKAASADRDSNISAFSGGGAAADSANSPLTASAGKEKGVQTGRNGSNASSSNASNGSAKESTIVSSAPRTLGFRVISVTVAEEELDRAGKILSDFSKDKTGYRIEGSADSVLNQLSELKGYSASIDLNADVDSDYIVLKVE